MTNARILIIEDNPLNLKLARSLLILGGYGVLEAADATSGMALALAERPDLILMDIQLPDLNGLEATQILKGQPETRTIPVVALTSFAMPGDDRKAREAGCDGYITKPIDTRSFAETVGRYLQRMPVAPPSPEPSPHHRPRILIVDDDPLNVKLTTAKLPAGRFEVITAGNGREAVEKTLQEHPELILLDVMMPGMDGYEVSHWLKENPATMHIPIILVTALDGTEDRIRGFEAGADEFLNKPVNETELLARINSLLRLKHYRDQLYTRDQSQSLLLPRPEAPEEDDHATPSRILLVEDDDLDAALIRNVFAGEPHHLETVATGEAALERLEEAPFDLVLLDILLPGLDGFEVCRRLKALHRTRETQVVAITSLQDLDSKVRGVESGADDYLVKPIHSRELRVRAKVLLKKKRYLDRLRDRVEQAVHSAIYDGLTGLYNQTYFKQFLEMELKRAERHRYPVGLMIVDIDDFKEINDRLGHLTGDLVIRELAQLLKRNVREVDLAARYGGDEFAIVFPYAGRGEAAHVVTRIERAMAEWREMAEAPQGGASPAVGFSIGVAFYPEQAATPEELIRGADEALYRAKKEGKNRCRFFGAAP